MSTGRQHYIIDIIDLIELNNNIYVGFRSHTEWVTFTFTN